MCARFHTIELTVNSETKPSYKQNKKIDTFFLTFILFFLTVTNQEFNSCDQKKITYINCPCYTQNDTLMYSSSS